MADEANPFETDNTGTQGNSESGADANNGDKQPSLADRIAEGMKSGGFDVSDGGGEDDDNAPLDPIDGEAEGDGGEQGGDGDQGDQGGDDGGEKPAEGEGKPEGEGQADEPDAAVEEEIKTLGIKTEPAQARFRSMASEIKRLSALKEPAEVGEAFYKSVERTQSSPEQVQAMFGYLRAVNGTDRAAKEKARETLMLELEELDRQLGETAPTDDAWKDYQDLKDAVDSLDLTEQFAAEIAKDRKLREKRETVRAKAKESSQQATQQQQPQQQNQAAVQLALEAVSVVSAKLRARDPDFAAKMKLLEPKILEMQRTVQPHLWAAHVVDLFTEAKIEKPRSNKNKPGPGQVPLRGGSTIPRVQSEPKSMQEAIARGGGAKW